MTVVQIVGTVPPRPTWPDRLQTSDWYHWSRYEAMLRAKPSWKGAQVESVAAESLRILRKLPDPRRDGPFQGRGLVVGYVQSGKTANYTAVAARAADAGYRIVIVLSGIHDSLRNQTQNRLEQELTGHQVGGVGPADIGRQWVRLTTPTKDFEDNIDVNGLQAACPFLIVAKKNVKILRKLDRWLGTAARYLADMPVLVIDDEADQASINTRGNRPPDPALADDDDDAEDADNTPSHTNALIRSLLLRAPKAAYVAYTATPFANIFIDPEGLDRQVGEDLFPRDFVVQLPRPEGYIGTEELFGVSAQRRTVRQEVQETDVAALRGPVGRRRRTAEVVLVEPAHSLPPTLEAAVLAFCVAGGIRTLRDKATLRAHTMLVHVSHKTTDQARIANLINTQISLWRAAFAQGQDLRPVMAEAWEQFRPGVTPPADDATIIDAALDVLRSLVVLVLNSETGGELEYDTKPGRHIIAVGGNRLSRGLTLEGLTISYFLRTAAMCDTLLQMARWYGFRLGYEDLIRIWTTDGIARWFTELALVEQSLRDAIEALERAGRTPRQMQIRVRAHSDLLLTARNKAANAVERRDSWSGEHPQTVLLPLHDPIKLRTNLTLTDAFVRTIVPADRQHGGFIAHDVSAEVVAEYLRGYATHDEVVAFQPHQLADWIVSRASAGELTDWKVFIASPEDRQTVMLGGIACGLVERRRASAESIGILIDPRHEGVDLVAGPNAYRREAGAYDADAMRQARPATQGLLIIYPLDPAALGLTEDLPAVIALGMSLPVTSDSATDWIVNAGVADD